jgi:hypothetical protein
MFEKFLETFASSKDNVKASKETLECYQGKLPDELLSFWAQYGFGFYGDGIVRIVEPSNYQAAVNMYLGREDDSRLPILMTGFGDIFYYRKVQEDVDDVSIIDIHHRHVDVVTWDLPSFFEDFIVDEDIIENVLRKKLFESAVKEKGKLKRGEIFYFVPALMLGGGEELKFVDKGNARIHQELLFEMGCGNSATE